MDKILSLIQKHYKITTATQVGLDTELFPILQESFWSVTFIDDKSEWSHKVTKQIKSPDTCNSFLYRDIEKDLIKDLEYLDYETDFVYIHNRHSADFKRLVFNFFLKRKTKFILTHPSVITGNTNNHKRVTIHTTEGAYKLFYLDIIYEEFEAYFRSKNNECD